MNHEASGKIYQFPLDNDLGYGYAELLDYSDVTPTGILLVVYNRIDEGIDRISTIDEIYQSGVMYGPVIMNSYPNIRGRKCWKLIGQSSDYNKESPKFKNLIGGMPELIKDWSSVSGWEMVIRFTSGRKSQTVPVDDYEIIRKFEIYLVYSTLSIITRTTMTIMLRRGMNVADAYDVTIVGIRAKLISAINITFPKEMFEELSKQISDTYVS